jgi:hypothetical protein
LNSALPCIDEAYSPTGFEYVCYRTYVTVVVLFLQLAAPPVRLAKVAATDALLLNKSSVDQKFSIAAAVDENPPTGIKFNLDLSYILDGLAEKLLQLRGHTLEQDGADGRGGPRSVVVLNVDNDVESCGVSPRVKLKLVGLNSSFHDKQPTTPESSCTCPT